MDLHNGKARMFYFKCLVGGCDTRTRRKWRGGYLTVETAIDAYKRHLESKHESISVNEMKDHLDSLILYHWREGDAESNLEPMSVQRAFEVGHRRHAITRSDFAARARSRTREVPVQGVSCDSVGHARRKRVVPSSSPSNSKRSPLQRTGSKGSVPNIRDIARDSGSKRSRHTISPSRVAKAPSKASRIPRTTRKSQHVDARYSLSREKLVPCQLQEGTTSRSSCFGSEKRHEPCGTLTEWLPGVAAMASASESLLACATVLRQGAATLEESAEKQGKAKAALSNFKLTAETESR